MVDYKMNQCIQFLFGGRESEEMGRKRTLQVGGLIMEWPKGKRHHGCWNINCRQE